MAIRIALEGEFYRRCAVKLNVSQFKVREIVDTRISKAMRTKNIAEEKASNVEEIYNIWGELLNEINKELVFDIDDDKVWSRAKLVQF